MTQKEADNSLEKSRSKLIMGGLRMIRLKILCLCAFFSHVASAYVLINCDLTEEGKIKFKASIQNKYRCSLSANHTYILHGAGEDFSSAWDDAVEACSIIYASQDECSAMIDSCEVVMEFVGTKEYHAYTVINGTCECTASVQGQSVCSKIGDYYMEYPGIANFVYQVKESCESVYKDGVNYPKSFPLNCNFTKLRSNGDYSQSN